MKKQILLISSLLLIISCSNKMEITNKGVNEFKLGSILKKEYNKEELDITLDSNKKIRTIIINSPKYKTKDGFGVGSEMTSFKKKYKDAIINENFNASKGGRPVFDLGTKIIHDSIIFVDQNKDNKVDFVLITR